MNQPATIRWQPAMAGRAGPLYRAIAAALAEDIANGTLPPGTRLPTHRDLAWDLKVTVGTITRAYQEAERQGLIGGEVGRGTFVRDPRRLVDATVEAGGLLEPATGLIDLSVNATALWPDAAALAAATQAVAQRPDLTALMSYQTPLGHPRLRAAIADWLADTAGLHVTGDQVLLAAGGQGAMQVALAAVTRPGDTLLVEQLTYPGMRTLALHLGLRLVPVPMDGEGLLPDAVEQAARTHGAHALYCMPTLQNPTTATLSLERRRALVSMARRIGLMLVEDDVYGFLKQPAVPTLASLGPDVTLYVSSLSKSLFPGLRTGYVIGPRPLFDRMATVLRATILTPAHLGTVVAAELIDSGEAGRIAQRRRALVAERQGLTRTLLRSLDLSASDPDVTHVWLPLPDNVRRDDLVRAALEHGVKITSAEAFGVGKAEVQNAVRICLLGVDHAGQLERGVSVLDGLIANPVASSATLV
ncbi:PLP-dependent aminotransferase family protein [Niveispirillum fermenti]|uniref:aminotransferase-like domain-containing protein n=1 Tax=Niveispirillum fermenti TaxID=1233113 RepID=UPI003A89896E